jgi:hypothetical protein
MMRCDEQIDISEKLAVTHCVHVISILVHYDEASECSRL